MKLVSVLLAKIEQRSSVDIRPKKKVSGFKIGVVTLFYFLNYFWPTSEIRDTYTRSYMYFEPNQISHT